MVLIERRVAQMFRAALRRCHGGSPKACDQVPVLIRNGKDGWTMHARQEDFTLIYTHTGSGGKGVFAFPSGVLAQFEGRSDDPVELSLQMPGKATAVWTEHTSPTRIYISLIEPEKVPILPELPKTFAPMPPEFLQAFHEASLTTAESRTKYVMDCVQLRGKTGQVVASDTRQLLIQGGFRFPFKEDLTVTRTTVFSLPAFQNILEIGLGRSDSHVVVRLGPWMFALKIEDGRFPDANTIVPSDRMAGITRFRLNPDDASSLVQVLSRRIKPSSTREALFALSLLDQPRFRYEMDGDRGQILLPHSERTGPPVEIGVNIQQFLRAVELRFSEFEIRDPDKPIVSREGDRIFMSMPVSIHEMKQPEKAPTKIEPPMPVPAESRAMVRVPRARRPIVVSSGERDLRPAGFDVVGEATGFRDAVCKAAGHAGRLLRFIREVCQQPKFTQMVRQSLLAFGDTGSEKR